MKKIYSFLKNIFFKIWFRFTAAEYMRIAYLHPRSVVLLTTSFQGKSNVMPLDWHTPVSYSPKLYVISIAKNNYTTELIHKSGHFVVNFMASEFEDKILACGRISGAAADKFILTGLEIEQGKAMNCVKLIDALGSLECKVINNIDAGDHVLFLGEVFEESYSKTIAKMQLHHTSRLL